jgi:hypothetical protein
MWVGLFEPGTGQRALVRDSFLAAIICITLLTAGCSSNGTSSQSQGAAAASGGTKAPGSATTAPGGGVAPVAGTDKPTPTASGGTTGGTTSTLETSSAGMGGAGSGVMSISAGAGAGGTTSGGTGGSSGTAGKAGMSAVDAGMTMTDDDAGVACIPPTKPLDFSSAPKCSMDVCPAQDSICFPTTSLANLVPQSTIDLLSKCDDTNTCVPLELANYGGKGIQPTCKSLGGVEGRCISTCVKQVAEQASILPKDTCMGSDLCAPCYDPRTGQDTLACRQGCDTGPKEGPKPFPKCCSDRGMCVPPALAGAQAKNLDKQSCTGENLCAPKELTDLTLKPKTCASLDGAEGRCISTCVGGAIAKQKDRLPTAGCAAEEVCAPCFDPVTGEDTGACAINGDMPAKPKQVFDTCCGMAAGQPVGVCVPPSLAGSQADILRRESCDSGRICAPIKKAMDPKYKFPTCTSLLGTGACVQRCILDPAQAAILSQGQCANGELCAPCDLLGTSTKACD